MHYTPEEKLRKLQKNREACAKWRDKNREYERERAKQYYRDNIEVRKQNTRDKYEENPEYFLTYQKQNPRGLNKKLLDGAKGRSKKNGWVCDLELSDIVIPEFCPILNIPIVPGKGKPISNSPSLDRVDNDKGYIKGNIRVISHKANRMKSNMTKNDIIRLYQYIIE